MNKTNWSRTRFANRPSKRKKQDFDQQNTSAAAVILSAPDENPRFLIDWAKAFMRRRARESGEVRQAGAKEHVNR